MVPETLLREISDHLRLSRGLVQQVIDTAPKRYKVYNIPKRDGGHRIIAHPARELKAIQRYLLGDRLAGLPVSPIAMAYVSDRGILKNAQEHVFSDVILKLDFKSFFNSIRPIDLETALRRLDVMPVEKRELPALERILFWGGNSYTPKCLSVGAPTSPLISNFVMNAVDKHLMRLAEETGTKVTRYADDITVSGKNVRALKSFESRLRSLVEKKKRPKLEFNDDKRGIYTRGQRRMVTGLILTPDGRISIGRERKREIHSLVHKCSVGLASEEQYLRAKGLIAFASGIENSFVSALNNKYGSDLIKRICRASPGVDPLFDL